MSEFKFACPVCGQHITADSSASGKELECPTCFQKIVAPQAPVSGDPKLILSATKATSARSKLFETESGPGLHNSRARNLKASLIPLLLLFGTGALAFLLWHNELTSLANGLAERAAAPASHQPALRPFQSPHPVPSGVSWTLNLTNAVIPNGELAGRVHGNGLLCERSTFKAGRLSFRQGASGLPDLGITVSLGVRQAQDLSGKAIVINPNGPHPAPHVVLRWKDDQQQPVTEHIHQGYAMKLIFGPFVEGRIRGRLFIALPDDQKSFATGNFDAEIISRPIEPLANK